MLWLQAARLGLQAQVGTEGAILGVVTDTTGAVVAGTEVTVTNLDTGLKKTMVTDAGGNFEVLALPRGPYSVSVSLPGFKTWAVTRTELTVGERKRLSPVLEVGEVTQKITVEATAELVQTEKGSVESVIEEKQIRELPLNGRNPVELVRLVPGVRYIGKDTYDQQSTVQGLGNRDDQSEFKLDGLNASSALDEHGVGIPNVDTIAEFNVETADFSAAHGRNPLQVIMVTKSGTNEFHGTVWEFLRNDKLDARNTFADTKPKLRRNQFGFASGGPIVKDRTHFFGSYEGIRIRQDQIFNSPTIAPEMLQGDFSSLPNPITDPLTGKPFQGNIIPQDRISNASKFFFPAVLLPNSAGNLFKAVAPLPNDTYEYTIRIDHQITNRQKIYGRYLAIHNNRNNLYYRPDSVEFAKVDQYNVGINYDYALSPTILLNVGVGSLRSVNTQEDPNSGKENLTQEAGIRGFPTAGREAFIGQPQISFSPYTGILPPNGDPYRLWYQTIGGNASLSLIRRNHSLVFGYQYDHRNTLARHGSGWSRGGFDFNGQYTGDAFADYLLGYLDNGGRNYPLQTFGIKHVPYSALFIQDTWKIHPDVTLSLGLRWDYWHEKSFLRGNGATFDPKLGKVIAGEDKNGQVDLTAQPVAPFLAKATEGLWIPASQASIPPGLFEANGYLSPRLGIAWRPRGSNDLVVRGGYGIFTSSYRGNISASAIVGPPYWSYEIQAWSPAQLQSWETAWPDNPEAFVSPSIYAAPWDVKSMKSHQWNVSVQKSLPWKSAITASYVGNRALDMIALYQHNVVPPGLYEDLQVAKPWSQFGDIALYDNVGKAWYNSMQLKWERRFSQGLSSMVSYAFSKNISENGGASIWDTPTPFAPKGYNRGRSSLDHTHILAMNAVWELPFGRERHYGKNLHPVMNGIVGGWQFSTIYNFISGNPLSFGVPAATLGNGWSTRPNLSGNPRVSNPTAEKWFNPDVFSTPPDYTFGNSGIGILDGPANHTWNLGLMKNFHFTERKFLQFRWELFNAINHVNLSDPVTTIGFGTTGQIFSAGDARQMQMALKFVF